MGLDVFVSFWVPGVAFFLCSTVNLCFLGVVAFGFCRFCGCVVLGLATEI